MGEQKQGPLLSVDYSQLELRILRQAQQGNAVCQAAMRSVGITPEEASKLETEWLKNFPLVADLLRP